MAYGIDDQPISATFFGEGKWLTEFVTPEALEIQKLYKNVTLKAFSPDLKVNNCLRWVAREVEYKEFISGKIWIEGNSSVQHDLWMDPSTTARVKVGNCANKSFLLCSLLRNAFPVEDVHVVLGNLYNGEAGGHAWVKIRLEGRDYICETTRPDVRGPVPAGVASRYEEVHLFNDKEAFAIEGRTVMEPFKSFYSTWLKDYLDWAYIEGRK